MGRNRISKAGYWFRTSQIVKPRSTGLNLRPNIKYILLRYVLLEWEMKMNKVKEVLTTGDVAKVCHVSARTVSKWFDCGKLKGYRIPGSKDRRIPLGELIRFLKHNNIPSELLGIAKMRVLVVDSESEDIARLCDYLENKSDYEVKRVKSSFETGLAAQKFLPHVMLVSLMAKKIDPVEICRNIRGDSDLQAVKVIAVGRGLKESDKNAFVDKGFDGYASDCRMAEDVVKKIEEVTAIIY
ncbi:MAG: helix-turn-helix domain-containing protein [Candidatus Brocadiia bacterium]|nr:MAG: helix-turn-helix domain-containing protein [Candidatus Brocadiia bacterium]